MAQVTIAEYNPATGAVTFEGETYTISEWRQLVANDRLETLRELNDARDESSDITNLPGDKPYFIDDWLYRLQPRKPRRGYTFQLTNE